VENVSWDDAVEFCRKLSQASGKTVRLPTEAQWEYACRAGSKTRFSYGDDPDYSKLGDYAWYTANSESKTHPVGQKRPNEWGLYDMHGNVWQWCSDWYADSYANANNTDPQGPDSGSVRVLRGGGWGVTPQFCRSASRDWFAPVGRSYGGFRVSVDSK
jgi:formylglycine-generating enzyme required for sulfatase activity